MAEQFRNLKRPKFTPSYWFGRLFRPAYTRDGNRQQLPEWSVRMQYGGNRKQIGLGTNNREEASRKAAKLYNTVRAKGWDTAMSEFRPDWGTQRNLLTVGDYISAVRPLVTIRPRTLNGYEYALRKIAAEATGPRDVDKSRFNPKTRPWRARANKVQLAKLTLQAIDKWKSDFIAEAGANPVNAQRARRNVNSFIRNARALFSRKILRRLLDYGVVLPSPLPLTGVQLERQGSTRYVSTINATELLAMATADLAESDPDAYVTILLTLGAGLRRGEVDSLCFTQVDFARGEIRILNTEHFQTKSEESEGSIFVHESLLSKLKTLQGRGRTLFVVEPDTAWRKSRSGQYYRAQQTFDRVCAWLRGHGVMADRPMHELRKEFGSILTAQADIHTASRQLRHRHISTTAAYYSDHRRRATVDVGAIPQDVAK